MLIVTKDKGRFKCVRQGDCGMCITGDGLSVLEAIGSWCLYSGTIEAKCDPPKLLKKFSAKKIKHYCEAPKRE